MIESKEYSAAKTLLRKSNVLRSMCEEDPDRYQVMEHYLDQPKQSIYTTEERRKNIANRKWYTYFFLPCKSLKKIIQFYIELEKQISVAPNSRLLTLLGQSLKWQQQQGILLPNSSYDIFTGTVPIQKVEEDVFASKPYVSIKFPGKKTYAESASFSSNGQYLATGSVDGFIEIWNYLTGKLRKDLTYQAKDSLMAMDKSVLCVQFSHDNELLASGSSDGKIAIWKVKTGQCQKRIPAAHMEGVTSIAFSKDSSQIVSGSYDQTIRIHGLKSGKMLKEMRGHSSFINSVLYSADNSRILSASSDGTFKVYIDSNHSSSTNRKTNILFLK